jgi:transcriptional regulator with XRE-family HTH domain
MKHQENLFNGKTVKFDGALLHQIRKALKINQKDVADQIGVSQKAISSWEAGGPAHGPNRQRVAQWCAANLHALKVAEERQTEKIVVFRDLGVALRFEGKKLAEKRTVDGDFAIYQTAGSNLVCDAAGRVCHGTPQEVFNEIQQWHGSRKKLMMQIFAGLDLPIYEDIA